MQKRNIGLDLMRATAIVLVLIDHTGYFFPGADKENTLAVLGFYGVELFFILSGFLIGQIALRSLSKELSWKAIKSFYSRRWLRTLPLYYVILIGFIIISNIIYKTTDFHWLHFIFLQNFFIKERYFLSIAWSLAIEEWFYLLLPVFFFLSSFTKSSEKKHFMYVIGVIAGILALRTIYVLLFNPQFEVIRVFIPLRFDSLLFGVLLAIVKANFMSWYRFLQQAKIFFLSTVFLLASSLYYLYLALHGFLDASIFFRSAGFSVISLLIALLIPFLENNLHIQSFFMHNKSIAAGVQWISLTSYSLYLIHLEIFTFLIVMLGKHVSTLLLIPMALCITFGAASLTYLYIEKPVLWLRDKYIKRA